jgi:hypothetical protein
LIKKKKNSKICWCITVPAIWEEPMKNIMIQASEKANLKKKGVDDKNFKIILEPEVYLKQ